MTWLRYLSSLTLLLLLPTLSFATDLKRILATSKITSVTVYPDRAQTTRSAALTLTPGSYLIDFESLPTLLMDDSVRVSGQGTAAATITGQEEIRALERKSAGLDARKAGIAAQQAFLQSIRVAWGDRISKELAVGIPTTAELLDASSFVGSGVTRTEEQIRDIEFEKQGIKDKIDVLRRQQNQATGSARKESKTVEVSVEIAREGTLNLELVAMIPQAGWEPLYDARLADDATAAEVTFRALVRQQSGEDWNNINLTLSTARPAVGGAPPELYPWNIALYRPQPITLKSMAVPAAAPRRAYKADQMQMDSALSEEVPAAFTTAQISDEQSSVSFHVPRKLDIPSDGAGHSTVIAVEKLPVSMEYLARPKLSPAVFLKSEMINQASYPLLPGKVNTFVGNRYTGSSQLTKIAAGEKFSLFFGSDDQVTVKRDEVKQRKEAGLFGKNRVSYRYRIELANFRKVPLILTLQDQLPRAADEEITVALDEPSMKPDEIKDDGLIIWKSPLSAGEKKELSFGITVEYPKEREITGL